MDQSLLVGIASVIVLGIVAQWGAWRLRLPSIMLLLLTGFIAGPLTGLLDPDALLGNLLFPVVSVSVAIILFEGGLSLRISELREIGDVVRNLVTVGALVTWVITILAGHFIVGLDFPIAILLGAILVVSGPTVVMPLLRHVRPSRQAGSVLKWEGIVIDPIGAMLAVLVFEAIVAGGFQAATAVTLMGLLKTILIGGIVGVTGAVVMILLLARYWVPDFLQNPLSLMLVVGAFTVSNVLQHESGLFAVTIMGIALANQQSVNLRHIVEFKENLRVLLISSIFILLAARLKLSDVTPYLSMDVLLFFAILVFVARPLSVAVSVIGSRLGWRERVFLAWMAPRGIVAAAVSSIFALYLVQDGQPGAEALVPITFIVIVGTVTLYGLTAGPVARLLKVAKPTIQGILIVGAHPWARSIAGILQEANFRVLMVDTNMANITTARLAGIPANHGSVLSDYILDKIELEGIGRLLALTSNDEVNSLAALHFSERFGRSEVYQLPPSGKGKHTHESVPKNLRGRPLFGLHATFDYLEELFEAGATVKATPITREFTFRDFRELYGNSALPLFIVDSAGELLVFAEETEVEPAPGQTVISIISETGEITVRETPAGDEKALQTVISGALHTEKPDTTEA